MEPLPFSQLTDFYRLRTAGQVWAAAWAFWWHFRGALLRALWPLAAAQLVLLLFALLLGQAGLSPELTALFRLGPYLAAALALPVAAAVAAQCLRAVPHFPAALHAAGAVPGWSGALLLWLLPLLVAAAPLLVAGPWGLQMFLTQPSFGAMLVLLGVPALWLAVRWALAVPAALCERIPAEAALRRSAGLVRGHWWATAGLLVAGGLGTFLLGWLASLLAGLVLGLADAVLFDHRLLSSPESALWLMKLLAGLVMTISLLVCWPVVALVLVFQYLSLAERTDSVALRLLSEQLGQPTPDFSDSN